MKDIYVFSTVKNGIYVINYTIIDPIDGTKVQLTEFSPHPFKEGNRKAINDFITVFYAGFGKHDGKRQFFAKDLAVIRLGWADNTERKKKMIKWLD